MNYEDEVNKVINQNETKSFKIKKLNDLIYDCIQQLEAEDQNMNSVKRCRLSKGLALAQEHIGILEKDDTD